MQQDPPPGFKLFEPLDSVIAAFAPVFIRRDEGHVTIGFRVGAQHCNLQGNCAGGVWATLADFQMGMNVGLMTGLSGPTVSMSVDYLGAARPGQWAEGRTRLLRRTPKLAFLDATFTVDGEFALRADGIFRLKWPVPDWFAKNPGPA